MLIEKLYQKKLINPPTWLPSNCCYLTCMGSTAYGCASDNSDIDIYGFAIPPKDIIFPHTAGVIFVPHGNGTWRPMKGINVEGFAQWQEHAIVDSDSGKEYDFSIFNIVRYFDLLIENNPNIIDSLFTPTECVIHQTRVATMIREQRRIFLHKGAWHRFKQYAISQLHKMNSKEPVGKRKEMREEFGFDVKFGYHVVRLLGECEDILLNGEIDLRKNNEQLKAIRRGEVPQEHIRRWAADKELQLEKLFNESTLQQDPPMGKIRTLLMSCLEEHYGSVDNCIVDPDWAQIALKEVDEVIARYRRQMY